MKKHIRKQSHNIPEDHSERMRLRKLQRGTRVASLKVKTGKYTPAAEDRRHDALRLEEDKKHYT